jgi:hypothetical protein
VGGVRTSSLRARCLVGQTNRAPYSAVIRSGDEVATRDSGPIRVCGPVRRNKMAASDRWPVWVAASGRVTKGWA